jgi:polysaccharide biosynthesis/export protein
MKQLLQQISVLILSALAVTSCVSSKKLSQEAIYFQKVTDSSLRASVVNYQSIVQNGDILGIRIMTANEASSRLLNQQTVPVSSAGSSTPGASSNESSTGYLVDTEGNISFPLIGKVHVSGSSVSAITDTLNRLIKRYVDDGNVSIRLLNFKITVLGEVLKPGAMSVPGDRVTILDAIGLAGDLSVFGRRDNIKVIREVNGKREMGTLNLQSGDIFSSPYYYLRQNDVVYVEMNERKMKNVDQTNFRTVSILLAAVTTIVLIVNTINNL